MEGFSRSESGVRFILQVTMRVGWGWPGRKWHMGRGHIGRGDIQAEAGFLGALGLPWVRLCLKCRVNMGLILQ